MKRFNIFKLKGAILLEVLIAVVILSTGLTAIIQSFSMSMEAYKQSREYLKATMLLEDVLSGFLLKRYADEIFIEDGEFEEPFSGYRYEMIIENVDGSEFLKQIRAAVFWKGKRGEKFIDAVTYLLSRPEEEGINL